MLNFAVSAAFLLEELATFATFFPLAFFLDLTTFPCFLNFLAEGSHDSTDCVLCSITVAGSLPPTQTTERSRFAEEWKEHTMWTYLAHLSLFLSKQIKVQSSQSFISFDNHI